METENKEVVAKEEVTTNDIEKINEEIKEDASKKLDSIKEEVKEEVKKEIKMEDSLKETEGKLAELEAEKQSYSNEIEMIKKQNEELNKKIEEISTQRKGLVSSENPNNEPQKKEPTPEEIIELANMNAEDRHEMEMMLKKTLGLI
jgi:hypothetical protein